MQSPKLDALPSPFPGRTGWPWTDQFPIMPDRMANGDPWPRVTVVTPSYNQAPYLEETIRSVLLQGYPNLEYILMDGGSTDGSVDIIKKYEPWLSYWVSEKDRGQSHAINQGWQRATGELVVWLNSDDYLEPGALTRAAHIYQKPDQPSSSGLIYGRANIVDQEGNYLSTIGWPYKLTDCLINLIDPIPQPSVFIPRRILDTIGLLDETLHYAMDLDLFIRILFVYPPVFIEEIWSNVRFTPNTKTSNAPLGFMEDQFAILDKIYSHPDYGKRYDSIRKVSYAAAYVRCARINLASNNMMPALKNAAKALVLAPGFTTKKLIKKISRI